MQPQTEKPAQTNQRIEANAHRAPANQTQSLSDHHMNAKRRSTARNLTHRWFNANYPTGASTTTTRKEKCRAGVGGYKPERGSRGPREAGCNKEKRRKNGSTVKTVANQPKPLSPRLHVYRTRLQTSHPQAKAATHQQIGSRPKAHGAREKKATPKHTCSETQQK
jgi:hypothetical protein